MQRLPNIQIGSLITLLTLAALNTLAAAQPATTPSDPQHAVVSTSSQTVAAQQDTAAVPLRFASGVTAAERIHSELGTTPKQAHQQRRAGDPMIADKSQETSRWSQDLALLAMSPQSEDQSAIELAVLFGGDDPLSILVGSQIEMVRREKLKELFDEPPADDPPPSRGSADDAAAVPGPWSGIHGLVTLTAILLAACRPGLWRAVKQALVLLGSGPWQTVPVATSANQRRQRSSRSSSRSARSSHAPRWTWRAGRRTSWSPHSRPARRRRYARSRRSSRRRGTASTRRHCSYRRSRREYVVSDVVFTTRGPVARSATPPCRALAGLLTY